MTKNQALVIEVGRWLEVQEEGGNNKGQLVSIFQRHLGGAVNEPWCMSIVQYCCYWVDQFFPSSVNCLYPSEHCMTVWRKSQRCVIARPVPGCVAIWNHKGTDSGHTGIVKSVGKKFLMTIEGNTGDDERRIVREGDGVYVRRRLRRQPANARMQLVGFLNPWP